MTIKTYRAATIAQALAEVKKDLGPDAVILHTRTIRSGGLLGIGASTTTEITATDQLAAAKRPRRRLASEFSSGSRSAVASTGTSCATTEATASGPSATASGSQHRRTGGAGAALAAGDESARRNHLLRSAGTDVPAGGAGMPARAVAHAIIEPRDTPGMARELAELKQMVGQVLQTARGGGQIGLPEALTRCYTRLLESEVSTEIADRVVGAVRDELSPAELRDESIVRAAVLRRLAGYIQVCEPKEPTAEAGPESPRIIALVGPTGVGKTTTIAKLAATYKLRHGRKVGLITCDTYRIAAVEQLRTYSNIIGIELHVALTPRDMQQCCEQCRDCDIILIDTAGRSPTDARRLDELQQMLTVAAPDETHLVLSSASSERVLLQVMERFGALRPDRVIFTKLDEAVNFGVLVNVIQKVNASLSFVTTGQEVPDHIEPGNADRLARLILDPLVAP